MWCSLSQWLCYVIPFKCFNLFALFMQRWIAKCYIIHFCVVPLFVSIRLICLNAILRQLFYLDISEACLFLVFFPTFVSYIFECFPKHSPWYFLRYFLNFKQSHLIQWKQNVAKPISEAHLGAQTSATAGCKGESHLLSSSITHVLPCFLCWNAMLMFSGASSQTHKAKWIKYLFFILSSCDFLMRLT